MAINPDLLKENFRRVTVENGGATAFGLRFYERLFEKYPAVKPLFNTPPEEQHKKLIASVGVIVSGVTKLDMLVPYLHAMGIRHLKYKTETGHYPAVGENLVAVLGEHLSAEGEFTEDMSANWQEAIGVVANVMIEAAEAPEKYADELAEHGYQPDGFKASNPQPWLMDA